MPRFIGYPVPTGRLRNRKSADLVSSAKSRLEHGRKFRREKREHVWERSERQYDGNHWRTSATANDPTADLITINMSFSTVNTLVPYVTGSDPRFLVEPYSTDASVRAARAQAAWINRWWRTPDAGARRAVRTAAVDSLIYGDGWGKVTYQIVSDSRDREFAEIHVDRLDPWDVWVDPMADGLHNARWVAHRVVTTLAEIEADETLYTKGVQPGTPTHDEDTRGRERSPENDTHQQWVEIFEFWDLITRTLVVFADGEYPLKVVEDASCPIVSLENHWLPGQPYHMGELEQIWPMQQELNKSRSQMITHRRRNIPKYFIRRDVLDEEGEAALASEVVNQMVPVNFDGPLEEVVKAVGLSALGADHYAVSDLIQRDIYEITGVNEYLRGATPEIRRTATEASIIEGASNVKTQHKLSAIEEFVRDLGTFVLRVAADVFPETEYDEMELFLTGRDAEAINKADLGERLMKLAEQGASMGVMQAEAEGSNLTSATRLKMGADIFVGVYQIEVVANSTEIRNPIFKEQKYREMAMALTDRAPMLAQLGVPLNLRRFFELWFEAAGIQDIDELFQPPGPPGPPGIPGQAPSGQNGQGEAGGGSLLSLMPQLPTQAPGPPTDPLTAENTGAFPPEGLV